MGTPLSVPKIPTIGIITAPNIMEEHPSIAEALPAFLPWDERAREKLAAPTTDKGATANKSNATITAKGAFKKKAPIRSADITA